MRRRWQAIPFALGAVGLALIMVFPEIALWLPDLHYEN